MEVFQQSNRAALISRACDNTSKLVLNSAFEIDS